jgi:hypothetical protein
MFPIVPNGKTPLFASAHPDGDPLRGVCKGECGRLGHGFYDATCEEELLTRWWPQTPRANAALRTGQDANICAVDVDADHGGIESARKLRPELPDTLTVKTPHGFDLYYQYHPDFRKGSGFLPGIDVRAEGGYVVVPPSVAAGLPCRVVRNIGIVQIGTVPAVLRAAPKHVQNKARLDTAAALAGVPEGQRDETLFRLACRLRPAWCWTRRRSAHRRSRRRRRGPRW